MGKKQIRNFSAEVKTKIVLEMLKEESTENSRTKLNKTYKFSAQISLGVL